ncbi:MAG TPA: ATP-binding protein [Dermatophilaceae bacterium]|nr:ATP-binding protein [Dermatophilaceae bacterium]
MDPTAAAILGGALGILLGAAASWLVRLSERSQHDIPPVARPTLPAGVGDVLAVLRSSAIVLDAADAVVKTSPAAAAHGLVRDNDLVHPELRHLARQVRRDGEIREVELDLPRGPLGRGRITVGARVAPLGSAFVLLLVDDRTQVRRVEEVRRDFVANVSHELKTPVGAIALLAEAVLDASDDPQAVARFAARMKTESRRLTRLVQEIVDLSRLQVQDTLHEPLLVDLAGCANEAVDRCRLVAEDRGIEITTAYEGEAKVYGDAELLTTAVRNLIENAVNYADGGTRVVVALKTARDLIELSVTDQGRGIPEGEQARVFERFYRVDPARSRATGGTGLGLAIVKHICSNHGGEVTLWSQIGQGSTFTIRLPAAGKAPAETVTPALPPAPTLPTGSTLPTGAALPPASALPTGAARHHTDRKDDPR